METQSQKLDTSAIKERQRKIWTSGDYAKIGNLLVILSELLCAPEIRSSTWRSAAVHHRDSAFGEALGQTR